MDDDILKEFVNESREHLSTIEADLLTIEEGGANIDEALVNKVFRAAHSIKGGSGFFGLVKVKELAHKAETVLDMLRSRKMAPNSEIINVLLNAFDKLREMINNTAASETADISDLAASLGGLAAAYMPDEHKGSLKATVSLPLKNGGEIALPAMDFERVKRSAQYIYHVEYDLIHDVEQKGKNVLGLFNDLDGTGEVLDCMLDIAAVGTLGDEIGNSLPLRLIFATVMEQALIDDLLGVPLDKVQILYSPVAARPAKAAAPAPSPLPEVAPPAAAPSPAADKKESTAHPPANDGKTTADDTLRVNVGLLETLMNLAGELVLGRNQLHAAIGAGNTENLSVADQRLNQVTSELQDAIMRTRLQPSETCSRNFRGWCATSRQRCTRKSSLTYRARTWRLTGA